MSDGDTQSYRDGSRSYDSYEEMQEEKQKQLAEFAAKFFGVGHKYVSNSYSESIIIPLTPHSLFDDDNLSPILMHLAKREMEKRGYESFQHFYLLDNYIYYINNRKYETFRGEGDNEYRAFWSALEQAVKGRKE